MNRHTIAVGLLVFVVVFQIALNVMVLSESKPPPKKGCLLAPTARML